MVKPSARGAHFGDAGGKVAVGAQPDKRAGVLTAAPAAVAQVADVHAAVGRHGAGDRPFKGLGARFGLDAQWIRGALIDVADALQAHADQTPRVELAADQVPLPRTEQIAARRLLSRGRVQKADAVDAPRPGVRNVDGRRLKRRLEAGLLLQLVDKAVAGSGHQVVQLVERRVVALVVGAEQAA